MNWRETEEEEEEEEEERALPSPPKAGPLSV
jgi:hypothetical protein